MANSRFSFFDNDFTDSFIVNNSEYESSKELRDTDNRFLLLPLIVDKGDNIAEDKGGKSTGGDAVDDPSPDEAADIDSPPIVKWPESSNGVIDGADEWNFLALALPGDDDSGGKGDETDDPQPPPV